MVVRQLRVCEVGCGFPMVGRDSLLAVAGASDETVYQHARRGVIALVQQITVEEFLPTLVSVNQHSSCLYGRRGLWM